MGWNQNLSREVRFSRVMLAMCLFGTLTTLRSRVRIRVERRPKSQSRRFTEADPSLLLAFVIRWLLTQLGLPLLGRRSNQLNYAPANRLPMTSTSSAVLLGPARPFE